MMVAQLEEEVGMGREGLVTLMNVRNLGYCQFCQRLRNSVLLYDRKTLPCLYPYFLYPNFSVDGQLD